MLWKIVKNENKWPASDADDKEIKMELHKPTIGGTLVSVIPKHIKIEHQEDPTDDAGSFTSGAWRTRPLNTLIADEVGITLSSNQITLPAGTYTLFGSAVCFAVNGSILRFQNITDGVTISTGLNTFEANSFGHTLSIAFVVGNFTIDDSKIFELQNICATTQVNNGMGTSASAFITGTHQERYAVVELQKIL